MPAKKRRCVSCKERKDVLSGFICNVGFLCSDDCRLSYWEKSKTEMSNKFQASKEKKIKARHKVRTKELRTRTEWYATLQKLENQWITKVRDVNEPCCTCGTISQTIQYAAGHCFPVGRGGRDPRRFELTNIHKQCNVECNNHGSGMRHEYERFIIDRYGIEHYDYLKNESNFQLLKDKFPHWTDIENEITGFRKLLRDAGIKPIV